jgi:hypothetical protein
MAVWLLEGCTWVLVLNTRIGSSALIYGISFQVQPGGSQILTELPPAEAI